MAKNPITASMFFGGGSPNLDGVAAENRFPVAREYFQRVRDQHILLVDVSPEFEARYKFLLELSDPSGQLARNARLHIGSLSREGGVWVSPTSEVTIGEFISAEDWEIELALVRVSSLVNHYQKKWEALAAAKGLDGSAYPLVRTITDEEVPSPWQALLVEYALGMRASFDNEMERYFLEIEADLAVHVYYTEIVEGRLDSSRQLLYLIQIQRRFANHQKTIGENPGLREMEPEESGWIDRVLSASAEIHEKLALRLSLADLDGPGAGLGELMKQRGVSHRDESGSSSLSERLLVAENAGEYLGRRAEDLTLLPPDLSPQSSSLAEAARVALEEKKGLDEMLMKTTVAVNWPLRLQVRQALEPGHAGIPENEIYADLRYSINHQEAVASAGVRWLAVLGLKPDLFLETFAALLGAFFTEHQLIGIAGGAGIKLVYDMVQPTRSTGLSAIIGFEFFLGGGIELDGPRPVPMGFGFGFLGLEGYTF